MRKALTLLVLFLLSGCEYFHGQGSDPHVPWYPHQPTAWRVTPAGYTRDAGPFHSVAAGWATEDGIDLAVDAAYAAFDTRYPEFAGINVPVAINDDYTLWVAQNQVWAAGLFIGGRGYVNVCLWARTVSVDDPGAFWIVRPPGTYWGVYYAEWRHTGKPLVPALTHELLHTVIGDPEHTSPLWARQ